MNLNRGLIKSAAQEVVMQAVSTVNQFSFLFRDRVNLFIGESHVRYLFSKKASSNPVFLNKIRKSDLLEDVYFVWSHVLAYKIVTDKLDFDLKKILCTGAKKNLFISTGEIDLRYYCADESGNKMSGKFLGELLVKRLIEISEMSCVDNVFYLMPLPPNRLLKNNQKYKGSFEARMAHYYDFVSSIEASGVNSIQLPFLEDKGNLPEEFLARDFIHLNQEGLNLVREDLKKYRGL